MGNIINFTFDKLDEYISDILLEMAQIRKLGGSI